MSRKDALLRLHQRLTTRRDALRKKLNGNKRTVQKDVGDLGDVASEGAASELNSQLASLETRELRSIERAVLMTGFSGHGFKFGALMGEMIAGLVGGRITSDEARRLAAGAVCEHTEIARLTSLCRG